MHSLSHLFSDVSNQISDLLKPEYSNIWLGKQGAFSMPMLELDNATNFRAGSHLHGKHDNVWLLETPLSDYPAWELLLDEAIRLLKASGKLIVKYNASSKTGFSNYGFKQRLFRNPLLNVRLEYEERLENNYFITVLTIERRYFEQYQNTAWSFAIITRGDRVSNVVQFCESIRQQETTTQHEILILGQPNAAYEPFNVTYLDDRCFRDELAEIAAKKNYIAQHAKHENLLISHDRYTLAPQFFHTFEQWGYDYDVATIEQFYETGELFPAYCYLQGTQLQWTTPVGCKNYNHLQPLHYLNGGLFIIKRQTLLSIPMNPLLCWNQAEDVEFSYQLRQLGLPPRINFISKARTLGITPTYTSAFSWDVDLQSKQKKPFIVKTFFSFAEIMAYYLDKASRECKRFLKRIGWIPPKGDK